MATASAPRQQLANPQPLAAVPNRNPTSKKFVRLTLWPLVAATFFMVSGGTYGTEDIVHGAGYGRGDSDSAAHPAALEPADRVHDRRAFERAALRRRLLRLGAPRHGQFLGISGSLALAGRVDFRYGDLSHAVRGLSDAHVSVVLGGQSRDGGLRWRWSLPVRC